jgi:penicillin G amidase
MKYRATLWVLVFTMVFLASCSSPTMQYLGYRIFPDDTPSDEEITIDVVGPSGTINVYLDEFAVPHIEADNEYDLFYALGYMHARDRRFQMEILKLLAAGRMRELIGDQDKSGVLTHLEVFSRMVGLYLDGSKMLADADPADIQAVKAYADGVNMGTEIEPKPLEFRLLDYDPPPWTTEDTGTFMAMVAFGLAKNWEHELGRLEFYVHQLRSGSTIERATQIWQPRFNLPPHLVGEKPDEDPFADYTAVAPELVDYLQQYIKDVMGPAPIDQPDMEISQTGTAADAVSKAGSNSNNWMVSGDWTGTGKGAGAADPHMPHSLPALCYLAHLKCNNCETGSYNVIGAGFMGLPAIAFGTNGDLIWGPTSNWADIIDLYVEKLVPGEPDYYYYKGEKKKFDVREEVFKIRQDDGSFITETRRVRSSIHGVLVNDFVERLPENFPAVALKRSYNMGKPITALRGLYMAENVDEAKTALYDFTAMSGHWSLADSSGNLLYFGSVLMPKRTTHLGTVPTPGWDGQYEWAGMFPTPELPSIRNPEQGFMGTANNQVVQPESFGWPINFEGDIHHRALRISQILGAGNNGTSPVEQMKALQLDGLDLGWPEVKPHYTPALETLKSDENALVASAAAELLEWDGICRPHSAAPTIFNSLNALLIKRALEDETSTSSVKFVLSHFNMEPLVYSILNNSENPAWDDRRTEKTESSAEVIVDVFRGMVERLSKEYGPSLSAWSWSTAAPFYLNHPFGGQEALAGYLNRGPYPTRGSGNTTGKHQFQRVQLTHFPIKYGPVSRVNVDLNDIAGSIMSIPGGQSGRPASDHYDDLLPLYLDGNGDTMDLDFENAKKRAVGHIILQPREN